MAATPEKALRAYKEPTDPENIGRINEYLFHNTVLRAMVGSSEEHTGHLHLLRRENPADYRTDPESVGIIEHDFFKAIVTFIFETEELSDEEFRQAFREFKRDNEALEASRIFRTLRSAFSPSQKVRATDHIFKAIYTVRTDHDIESRCMIRMTAMLHDLGKAFLVKDQSLGEVISPQFARLTQNRITFLAKGMDWFYRRAWRYLERKHILYRSFIIPDKYQDHAALSAAAAHTILETMSTEIEQIQEQMIEQITESIRLHHLFEVMDMGHIRPEDLPGIFNLAEGESPSIDTFTLLARFAITDVSSVSGYEKFLTANVHQILIAALTLFHSSEDLEEVLKQVTRQLSEINEYIRIPQEEDRGSLAQIDNDLRAGIVAAGQVSERELGYEENALRRFRLLPKGRLRKIRDVFAIGDPVYNPAYNHHYDFNELSRSINDSMDQVTLVIRILKVGEEYSDFSTYEAIEIFERMGSNYKCIPEMPKYQLSEIDQEIREHLVDIRAEQEDDVQVPVAPLAESTLRVIGTQSA